MSLLSAVISSMEQTDMEGARKNLPLISEKIIKCKEEINSYINDVYHEFSEWPKRNQHLLDTTTQTSNDIKILTQRIEQITLKDMTTKVDDVTQLAFELERSNIALGIVMNLIQINELLANVKELQKKKQFVKAARELLKIEECIENIPEDEQTKALTCLKTEVAREKNFLAIKLAELFEDDIKLLQAKSGAVQTNTIKIRKKDKEFSDALGLLTIFEKVGGPLNKLTRFVYEFICKPIITHITSVKCEDEDSFYVLNVAVKKSSTKIPYKDVFSKLIEVFGFLRTHFNYEIGELKTIAYIGNQIKYDLSEIILKDCLSDTLPSSDDNCKLYKTVIEDIKVFQMKLVELQIFDAEANPILDYANNMDIIFINKKCHEYMSTAICCMKKDLHDLVDVGVDHDTTSSLTTDEFPRSSVSRSTIEILQIAEEILQQASAESDLASTRMICTVQSIFYQYGNIVHGHHHKLLQTIPQQVALFRNNCMYIAHELSQFNEVYAGKFSQAALPSPPLFTDQSHQLRTIGGEIFLAYVEEQVQLMDLTLQEFDFNSQHVAQELNPDSDKCLRQCIRQHELLKTVWLKVLPHSVYNKTVGYLLNTFCKKLIEVVLGAEDITSKNAEMLVELYKVVLTRGPKLFTDSHEISLLVESWQKLNDLVFILAASLIDICHRWSEGKGPLTLTFAPEELRNLIKALFQNTDRRTAALKKIHN